MSTSPLFSRAAGSTTATALGPYASVPAITDATDMLLLLTALTSKSRLDRDRAVARFRTVVNAPSLSSRLLDVSFIQQTLLSRLVSSEPWYSITASVTAICHLLSFPDLPEIASFTASLEGALPLLITHHEARVRESGIALIAALAKKAPKSTWTALSPMLFARADDTFALDVQQRAAEASRIAARDVDDKAGNTKTKNAQTLLHETEGWRGLETTLLTQAALTRHSSPFSIAGDSFGLLLTCAERARPHPNRFVREAGLHLIDAVVYAAAMECELAAEQNCGGNFEQDGDGAKLRMHKLITIAEKLLPSLRAGLQDNWSQVRFAACVATRTLMMSLSTEKREQLLFPDLLPRLCLNRHYVAEGVKSYSHETWRLLFEGTSQGGRLWLASLLPQVVSFFSAEIQASNHAVREAACQSFGELATRLPTSVISPHAAQIACALHDGFKDESWPVRDHACGALADVLFAFPREMEAAATASEHKVDLSELHSLFARHLADNIASVRRNCAMGFVRAVASFLDTHSVMGFSNLITVVRDHLQAISEQKNDIVKDSDGAEPKVTRDSQFGSSTRLAGAQVHDAAHTNQTMYSCGSLAPKLRRGAGCCDHGFVRPREQWEIAEGGVMLWGALAKYSDDDNKEMGAKRAVDARKVATSLFADVLRTCVVTCEKKFRLRSKLLITELEAVTDAMRQEVEVPANPDAAQDLVKFVYLTGKDEAAAVRAKSKECRRMAMRAVGLRKFNEMEKALPSQ